MRGPTAAGSAAVSLSGGPGGGPTVLWWLLTGVLVLVAGAVGYGLGRRGGRAAARPVAVPPAVARAGAALDKRTGPAPKAAGRDPGRARAWGPVGQDMTVRAAALDVPDRRPAKVSVVAPAPRPAGSSGSSGPAGSRPGRGRGALVVVVCLAVLGAGVWWLTGSDGEEARPGASAAPGASASTEPPEPGKALIGWRVPWPGGREEGPGAWALPDGVVDARADGLTAYGMKDGKPRWRLPAPVRQAVCRMSPGVSQRVGLVAYGRHNKPCATVAAVHTETGRELWRRSVGGDEEVGGLAVGGPVAVVAGETVVRGRSAESGAERWARPNGRGCAVRAIGADPARTLLVEQCEAGGRVVALDTATGRESWRRALDVESTLDAAVVSTTPAVVAVRETDTRGTRALLAFDGAGRPLGSVPLFGPDGEIDPVGDPVVVRGDRLYAMVRDSGSISSVVAAYALKDGRRLWQHREVDRFEAVAAEPDGTVGFLTGSGQVVRFDAATGAVRGRVAAGVEPGTWLVSISPLLFPVAGGHIVVNRYAGTSEPAVFALR
ncbi:PQQ-binding-like beta-propeller repeat protein [Streptomyces sp. NPDC090025]|uniref:outer membrane protein assembly factor BamB family protein n=1 Tax=Streptomyces sp. NPDC090025 TaxID=3365922 RepID=UPI003838BEF2